MVIIIYGEIYGGSDTAFGKYVFILGLRDITLPTFKDDCSSDGRLTLREISLTLMSAHLPQYTTVCRTGPFHDTRLPSSARNCIL